MTTEPGRLRLISAAIVVLVLFFGASTTWQVLQRESAARDVVKRSQPLSADSAEIYRFLADADATAASGFLVGGQEPKQTRDRYNDDVQRASALLTQAAANTRGSALGQAQIALLNQELPRYTGLVEGARANNRQGLPLGGAYLRYASEQMRKKLLPAAERLYQVENTRLSADYRDAESYPWLSLVLGVIALAGLVWAQRRIYHRTHRVFNIGLVGATLATITVLVWLVAGHTLARSGLQTSHSSGARSLQALGEARIAALKARGDENLTLVARGAGATYEQSFKKEMDALSDGEQATGRGEGPLHQALRLADDREGRAPVNQAISDLKTWQQRHQSARASDDDGNYEDALAKVIGGHNQQGQPVTETTGKAFDSIDKNLSLAVKHEQAEFENAANDGRSALVGLSIVAAVVTVLGAGSAVLGIGRRLAEYR